MSKTIQAELITETKEKVLVNRCALPQPFDADVVKIDVKQGDESRYRLRIKEGVEARATVSKKPHFQTEKKHKSSSIYLVHQGWIAILCFDGNTFDVDIAFGKCPGKFYVEAPGDKWYAAYLSSDVVFTYASSDTETGEVRDYLVKLPTEHEIIDAYASKTNLDIDTVTDWIKRSY